MNKTSCTLPPVDSSTYRRIAHYAKVVGKPIDYVVNKALNGWMDESGDIILKSYQELVAKQRKAATRRIVGEDTVVEMTPTTTKVVPFSMGSTAAKLS